MSRGAVLYGRNEQLRCWAVSSRHVQQHDGAWQHITVPALLGGNVLRGCRACSAYRELQRGLLLQRRVGGGGRERVRQPRMGVRQPELRVHGGAQAVKQLRGPLPCGVVLSGWVGVANAMSCGAVLRDCWAAESERAMPCRVLLQRPEQLEPQGSCVPCGVLLSGWDSVAGQVRAGDVS